MHTLVFCQTEVTKTRRLSAQGQPPFFFARMAEDFIVTENATHSSRLKNTFLSAKEYFPWHPGILLRKKQEMKASYTEKNKASERTSARKTTKH